VGGVADGEVCPDGAKVVATSLMKVVAASSMNGGNGVEGVECRPEREGESGDKFHVGIAGVTLHSHVVG